MTVHVEELLLERARNGDMLAFEALQALLEDTIRGYIKRLLGRHDAEDDIVQNTFIALYKNLERLDTVDGMRAFVFRVIRNQCYDYFRHNSRYDVVSLDDGEWSHHSHAAKMTIHDESLLPEDTTHWRLLYDRVMEAMSELPDAQRLTLMLYTHEQLSYQEIADACEISIGTVKSRLYRAKLGLKRLLDADILEALGIIL